MSERRTYPYANQTQTMVDSFVFHFDGGHAVRSDRLRVRPAVHAPPADTIATGCAPSLSADAAIAPLAIPRKPGDRRSHRFQHSWLGLRGLSGDNARQHPAVAGHR